MGVVLGVGLWRRAEGDDGGAGVGRGVLAGLGGAQGVARLDLGGGQARGFHMTLPGGPDLPGRCGVARGGGVSDKLQGQAGDVGGAGFAGGVLHLGISDLRAVEVPAQAVEFVPGPIRIALDALSGGVKRPDQGLADDGLEVLQCGVAENIEGLGQDGMAKLDQGVFVRVGPRIIQGERLGFKVGQMAGER